MDIKFDYNEYWAPEKPEPKYVEESSDVTDQDFWELHKFVLETELDAYGDIYSESVGSSIKAGIGTIIDRIFEVFLRICEAFKQKSMKKAIKWLKENAKLIKEKAKEDDEIHKAMMRIKRGHVTVASYALAFEKWANKEILNNLTDNNLISDMTGLSKSTKEKITELHNSGQPNFVDNVIDALEDGEYDKWYKTARYLRTEFKRFNRMGQKAERSEVEAAATKVILTIPTTMLQGFDDITEGIKDVKSRMSAITKAEAKDKKKNQTPKPTTESYYVSFEPEVDILF